MADIFIKHRKRGVSMSRILLLEDDLSLINGLSFAFQKAGYDWMSPEPSKRLIEFGGMENMTCSFWM